MPALLAELSLHAAAEDLVDRLPIPTDVDLRGSDRALPAAVEHTAYFVVAEALADAVKHSRAREPAVRLGEGGGILRHRGCDDGVGGAAVNRDDGLGGLEDRLDVVGGRLRLDSPAGQGAPAGRGAVRVVAGEDEALMREGLVRVLELAGMEVAGPAGYAEDSSARRAHNPSS